MSPTAPDHDLDAEALSRLLGEDWDSLERARRAAAIAELVADMKRTGGARDDPMRELFSRLGDRWSVLILLLLDRGALRHAALRRLVAAISAEGAISQRMLTLRLRGLERDGLVGRMVVPTIPPQVSYELTPLGVDFLRQIEGLMEWVRRHNAAIREARARFDAAD